MVVKRNKILIVEDEESLLKLETIILSSKGYDVVGFTDGAAAIEEISRNIPDIVILDIMLPGMDGFEICRRIKSDSASSRIPVIMLTARKNSQDMERGLKAGAAAYMTKPFKAAQLIGTIERILSCVPE
jgi:twitching motility two-component system response regulator PilG